VKSIGWSCAAEMFTNKQKHVSDILHAKQTVHYRVAVWALQWSDPPSFVRSPLAMTCVLG
jgi:hypothetical protein